MQFEAPSGVARNTEDIGGITIEMPVGKESVGPVYIYGKDKKGNHYVYDVANSEVVETFDDEAKAKEKLSQLKIQQNEQAQQDLLS